MDGGSLNGGHVRGAGNRSADHADPHSLAAPLRGSAHDLGPQLEPALKQACDGKLRDVHWFRTDWQIGGAATAYASFIVDGAARPVVVKLPVGYREYRTITGLCETVAPTPRIAAHGMELGGYDMAWVVMECVAGDPLAAHLHPDVFQALADAAAMFYQHAAQRWPLESPNDSTDWAKLLEKAREELKVNHVPDEQRWNDAIRIVQKCLAKLLPVWGARPINTWCHGDLHPGNLMRRDGTSAWGPEGNILLDFAETHPGHWVEDAVYLERIYWGRPQALNGVKPVQLIAKARRAIGLDTNDDYATLANVRRVLMAATSPAFMHHEGRRGYLHAAIEVLEKTLPQVVK